MTISNTVLRERLSYVPRIRLLTAIQGFDEFMNVTLAEAEEVPCSAEKARKPLGMYLIVWMLTRAPPAWRSSLFFILLFFFVRRSTFAQGR